MERIKSLLLTHVNCNSPIEQVSVALDNLEKQAIDKAPWDAFNYVPKVEFVIAHHTTCIFLKYYVEEEEVKTIYNKHNDPVYKDSCVEFFLAFNKEEEYYNLECNAIGACLLHYGKCRSDRKPIPASIIKKIKYVSTIQNGENTVIWHLCLMIPITIFFYHPLTSLNGLLCNANFYKCGDDLLKPHFLCWNFIDTPEPDFHVRSCFGEIFFE